MLSHWDELEESRRERGHIAAAWTPLTGRVSVTCGANRIRVDPGRWSTPAHVEGAGEEIFYVLAGSGISWQDGACYSVGAGDCIVHRPRFEAHTLRAGDEGLEVLVFGHRLPVATGYLPRVGMSWLGPSWTPSGAREDHPWAREAEAGPPAVEQPRPRPENIVALDDLEGDTTETRVWKPLARAAGAQRSGLNHTRLLPGVESAPLHCHSAEEEVFVILDGEGVLVLHPSPMRAARGAEPEEHPLRRGHVVVRPPGTGIAHLLRAGDAGLTYLAYGTKEPNDICYYPRSNKFALRGIGLIGRIEPLDYWDGEPQARPQPGVKE